MRRVLRASVGAVPYLAVLLSLPASLVWILGIPGNPRWWEMAIWLLGFVIVSHHPVVVLVLGLTAWQARRAGDDALAAARHRLAWVAFLVLLLPLAPVLRIVLGP